MKVSTVLAASSVASVAFAVEKVTVKGNAFYAGNDRFYVRGVDYQPGGDAAQKDPIADTAGCKRDVAQFKKLGINTVRVYTVDNTADHDTCMGLLADEGIYLALDVNNKDYSINRAEPEASYNDVYLQNVFATIDAFQKYDNTLLFFSGNEVINDNTTTPAAPYVKATTRDMRAYIKAQGYRAIPVGYSAADVEDNRFEMASYMNCGSDEERSDFFAFNDYSWCDPSTFEKSGWDKKVEQYKDYSIPLFLSEYGCNAATRKFEEVAALYSTQMTAVYSGGLVYEYSQEDSNYGLVDLSSSVSPRPDFSALRTALANTPPPTGPGGAKSSPGQASECPPQSPTWDVDTAADLPAMPLPAKKYLQAGAGAGPGLQGKGSQSAGTPSSGFKGGSSGSSGDESEEGPSSGSSSSAGSRQGAAAGGARPGSGMLPLVWAAGMMGFLFVGAATYL